MSEAIILYRGRGGISEEDKRPKVYTNNGVFKAPFTGNYLVSCVGGGGGGGGGCRNIWNSSQVYYGAGGSRGGFSSGNVWLNQGDEVMMTMGSGGSAGTNNTTVVSYNSRGTSGSAGSTTTFGSYKSAAGGSGGSYSWMWRTTYNNPIWKNEYKYVITGSTSVATNGFYFEGPATVIGHTGVSSVASSDGRYYRCWIISGHRVLVNYRNITYAYSWNDSENVPGLKINSGLGNGDSGWSDFNSIYPRGSTSCPQYYANTTWNLSDTGMIWHGYNSTRNDIFRYGTWNVVSYTYGWRWNNIITSWNNGYTNSTTRCYTSIQTGTWWYLNNNAVSTAGTRAYSGDGGQSGSKGNAGFILIYPQWSE